jgi:hypothetical protein
VIEEQDEMIAAKSGRLRLAIKHLTRSKVSSGSREMDPSNAP